MASQARQSKVLCIRVIQDKNVLDRTMDPGDSVSVGTSSKNTFVLPKSKLPEQEFQLFKAVGNGYVLRFTEGMSGKIESSGSVSRLQQLFSDGSVTRAGGVAQVPLTDRDRGKIKFESVTVLFQFLPAPPAEALKPIQQMDFRGRLLDDDDPIFLGFLAIWAALATVLVIWVWNTEPREYQLEDIPDRFAKVIMEPDPVPVVEEPDEPEEPEETQEPDQGTPIEQPKAEPEPQKPVEKPPTEVEQVRKEEKRKEEIVKDSALLKILATTGESSAGVVANLWTPEEQGLGDIDAALAEKSEVLVDGGGLRNVDKGGNEAVKVDVKGIGGGSGGEVTGPAVAVKPRVRAESGTVDASGDEGAVKGVVQKYTGQLTYCYEKRLKAVPTLEGRIEVGWSVSGGAVVGSPYIILNGTGDAELADCITKKIRRWRFPADVEGEVSWPFAFQAKK